MVAMPLGQIQAAARRSDDLQHSQHFLGRSLDHQRSLGAVWIEGRFAQASGWAKPVLDQPHDPICRHSRATVGLYDGETVCI